MEHQFEYLKTFFECYFNMSADYEELGKLALAFRESATTDQVVQFIEELNFIINNREWGIARLYINEYGMRYPKDDNKMIWILETIRNQLVEANC